MVHRLSNWGGVALWLGSACGVVGTGLALWVRKRRPSSAAQVDGSAPLRSSALRPAPGGLFAGRYRLVRELGRGANGIVHLADDLRDGGQVAVKTIVLPAGLDDEERAEAHARFAREAALAGRLCHPGIVTVRDAGEADGTAFIAMEVLGGTDLEAHAHAGALLPAADVLRIGARVALALDHAHRQGVVHRDVKPANLVWNAATGVVKVTDFGIASVADAERTRTGLLLGTPLYASPEQIAGGRVDGRSDLYSLGVVLYQLLTGALPYRDGSMADLLRQIMDDPPPSLANCRPELAAGLDPLLARVLAKSPGLRPDARAVAADLLAAADRLSGGGRA